MGRGYDKKICSGVGQLTLVEHALCPVDARGSSDGQSNHDAIFSFSDRDGNRRSGHARVFCPLGLSPQDEFFIWGLLALTLADPDNDGELHATRHYLLRRLGVVTTGTRRGGRQYQAFSKAIDRIAAVQYFNDSFYDPIRSEHVRINFKFFSYSMPVDQTSSRAWRIVWDPVFFSFARAARGSLRFDLELYRKLSVASRRLYLFASKLLYQREKTFPLQVTDLVSNVLGYSDSLPPFEQNARLRSCIKELTSVGILNAEETRIEKKSKGLYSVVLARGNKLQMRRRLPDLDSPLLEPLLEIGLDGSGARNILNKFPTPMVREWIDITLAAKERFGMQFFSTSPAAFLRYSLNRAKSGTGTPPDWWHEIRRAEQRENASRARKRRSSCKQQTFPEKAMDSLANVNDEIFGLFVAAGQAERQARLNSSRFSEQESLARRRKTSID